ncbi:MAG: hypothetical protein GXW85_04985 [Clostridia bacterium]|nr:hypothetical protein [Clostridia bacterium]
MGKLWENVNGTWTEIKQPWENVNGVWTKIKVVWENVNGTWIKVWEEQPTFSLTQKGELVDFDRFTNKGVGVNAAIYLGVRDGYIVRLNYTPSLSGKGLVNIHNNYDIFDVAYASGQYYNLYASSYTVIIKTDTNFAVPTPDRWDFARSDGSVAIVKVGHGRVYWIKGTSVEYKTLENFGGSGYASVLTSSGGNFIEIYGDYVYTGYSPLYKIHKDGSVSSSRNPTSGIFRDLKINSNGHIIACASNGDVYFLNNADLSVRQRITGEFTECHCCTIDGDGYGYVVGLKGTQYMVKKFEDTTRTGRSKVVVGSYTVPSKFTNPSDIELNTYNANPAEIGIVWRNASSTTYGCFEVLTQTQI